ncbi:uncharacterized protein Z518_01706 [Rhinocladiella mackenziei CBS 650.93]|uniref:EH domain-containing protein n=1 Tax=Rhinocladiella mackenziei CBS 650.93 TaxID=1442369 RepID=A0A0D2G6N3_9EURO|nr:uncharacterized protein Z518_01706 [Rhinocladiella mackenziei CBS 650.93]KIX10622.1 hypothetical protein Z518_01706 [Rhinocladiella mackenziei CBS 650.93]
MLAKGLRRLVLITGLLIFVACAFMVVYGYDFVTLPLLRNGFMKNEPSTAGNDISETHHEVFSVSTPDRKYFWIEFGEDAAMNPNILPHPTLHDTWIIVAQEVKGSATAPSWFTELVCEARFKKGRLACIKPPKILPIAATTGDKCVGDLSYFGLNIGPHDARVFYGPKSPYVIYGSNSVYTCFGQWIQDFRMLVGWPSEIIEGTQYRMATELRRPAPFGPVEKNWFIFWDKDGDAYVHYDIFPNRVFAKLEEDGSVGENLAPLAMFNDQQCMNMHMPRVAEQLESIHQATNSLSITLCERSDLSCEPNDSNTYILTIFQHKSFYSFHSEYEPYVMLFEQTAPFGIYGISSKPIWIHGRKAGEAVRPDGLELEALDAWNQSEMFYVTSISWKSHGQEYHGYSNDVLFINFGIEDAQSGGIDVVAGDLLEGLKLCSSV